MIDRPDRISGGSSSASGDERNVHRPRDSAPARAAAGDAPTSDSDLDEPAAPDTLTAPDTDAPDTAMDDGAVRKPGAPAEYSPADPERRPLRAEWDPTVDEPHLSLRHARPGMLRRFVATYGWRAYALPLLFVLTVFVIIDAVRTGPETGLETGEPALGTLGTPPSRAGIIGAPPGDGEFPADLPTGALPEGGAFAESGAGAWRVARGGTDQKGVGEQYVFSYTVEVENGIDTSAIGGDDAVARMVDSTLANPKSWVHDRKFAFRRIDHGEPDFRISLTSRQTTRNLCGFEIPIDSSCYNSDLARVVLSEARWVRGALAFNGDIGSYRQYLVNHEVGHAIGYHQHQPCENDGGLAPVMMQQTFGTANNEIAALDPHGVVPMDGKRCRFNPWPYPRG
ncbi:DUF3152 domain-containing protein [Nocardia brevicatena]|uniref:DUF3152 domain-containing protein n=1 Tax=Nocardia brevicatena TaxID=37327 RepID=UPI0002D57914|nr:DUF3152 domain-containing protein [Nocardia brevicatena]